MSQPLRLWIAAIVVAALWSADANAYLLRGGVMANGGTLPGGSTNGTTFMVGTAGQVVVGLSGGVNIGLSHGFWSFGGPRLLAAPSPGGPLPIKFAFGIPTPNPAHVAVRFQLALPQPARVDLAIYDVSGRETWRAPAVETSAGYHTLSWGGVNAVGQRVTGVFFARLEVDGRLMAKRRIVMVR